MKSVFFFISFALISFSAAAQEISYPREDAGVSDFELVIKGITAIKGEIRVALFNSEDTYSDKKQPLHAVVLTVKNDTAVWNAPELPFGEYAIAVYHDKNMNGKLDSNLLGIPKEAYGFSNNARGRFGPASWKDAHFKIEKSEYSISIDIQ